MVTVNLTQAYSNFRLLQDSNLQNDLNQVISAGWLVQALLVKLT